MPLLLKERLMAERQRYFVGRQPETAAFANTITAKELPLAVLHYVGVAGIGKTALLKECNRICKSHGVATSFLDARTLEPTAAGFLSGLQKLLPLTEGEEPIQFLATRQQTYVLFLDSYDFLFALDDWLREEFLPQLSTHLLVVLASRHTLPPGWRIDPGWQTLLLSVPLTHLSVAEAEGYLNQREVAVPQQAAILEFSQGHPLSLSLLADALLQTDAFPRAASPSAQPTLPLEVLRTLLVNFLEGVPNLRHRQDLMSGALVESLLEALWARPTELENIHSLQSWLQRLSFIESGRLAPKAVPLPAPLGSSEPRSPVLGQVSGGSGLATVLPLPPTLSQSEFVLAVRDALRFYSRPDGLYSNPLLRSRLVLGLTPGLDQEQQVVALQHWVREATESLKSSPRDVKLYRALYCTYISPAATQEQAAESLDLPFSTYRRHLTLGINRIASILWQREVRGFVPQVQSS